MCNCNQKRMSMKQTSDIHYKNMIKVTLKGSESLVVNGSITGRTYIFKNKGDLNLVDKRDLNDFKKHTGFIIAM